ncbi:hypothetical protein Ate01nite_57970 [Actinoplanes teichomyceticus]|nr:hypothetical protein Ate01nite_57970 [Actinoplanes teichomyceticus]
MAFHAGAQGVAADAGASGSSIAAAAIAVAAPAPRARRNDLVMMTLRPNIDKHRLI